MDLHTLCKSGDLKSLRILCDKSKSISKNFDFIYKANTDGKFPLDITVLCDHFDCCKYLFETFDVDPLKINPNGESAFSYALQLSKNKFLKFFIENRKKYLPITPIEDFMTKIKVNKSEMCPLKIVMGSSHPDCGKTLIFLIENLKLTFMLRKTLFIEAVKISNIILIEYILNYNEIGQEEQKELLNLNFNPESDFSKKSLFAEAITTPLIFAIESKDHQLVNFLLSQSEVDVNAMNMPLNNTSPLISAIKLNDIETVMLLVEKDVKKDLPVNGILPMELVIKIRSQYISDLESNEAKENWIIFEMLATTPNDAHFINNKGMCAFDYAVKNKLTDVIQYFVSLKCDLFKRKNRFGKAPIDYADKEYDEFLRKNLS
ncbi:unnamed protein product [Brachionus calyciflorus]|uniref:Uncharacterized protein n=1 Tax=Brachionus calyciflorus TaxID=104777 RepID=A0A814K9Z5_9BILA|nr:unnamed protein product [Brachionus calyciflorus]